MIKILFLASNPQKLEPLQLDTEVRAIDQALRLAEHRDHFDLRQHWAVRISDLQELLLRHRPQIVHFSGHGIASGEIVLGGADGSARIVSSDALSDLFTILQGDVRCVILNACHSAIQANAIAQNVDCVIGMSDAIGDEVACNFSAAFYGALAYGCSVSTAFRMACNSIDLTGLPQSDIPRLIALDVNPELVSLVDEQETSEGQPTPSGEFARGDKSGVNRSRIALFSHIVGFITGLFSNVVVGYIMPTFEQHAELAITLFLICSLTGLLLILYQEYYKISKYLLIQIKSLWTRSVGLADFFSVHLQLLYNRPRLLVYLASIPVLVALILAGGPLISDTWAQVAPQCPPDRTCILIADFTETALENKGQYESVQALTQAVMANAKEVVDVSGDGRFTIKQVAAIQDEREAQTLAREQKALLVIWGNITENSQQLTIKFALADLLGAGGSTDVSSYRIEPQLYDPIDRAVTCRNCLYTTAIGQDVSQQVRIIAYTATGLLHYVQGRPEDARLDFAAALYCAGQKVDDALVIGQPPLCEPKAIDGQSSPDSNYALLYYYLGNSLLFRGDYASALTYLKQADALNPHDPASVVKVAAVYQRWLHDPSAPLAQDYFEVALARADQLMDTVRESERADLYYLQGVIYKMMADYGAAQERYGAAIMGYEQSSMAHVSAYNGLVALGHVQFMDGKIEVAEATLAQALALDDDAPWAYLELARLYHRDAPHKAEDQLNKALQQAPNAGDVHLTRAQLYTAWEEYDDAEAAYEQALRIRKGSGSVYNQIGAFWHQQQDYAAARNYYRMAVERRPCDPWMHERMAFVLGKTDDHKAAAGHYQRALDLAHQDTAQKHVDRLTLGLNVALERSGVEMDELFEAKLFREQKPCTSENVRLQMR